MDSYNSRYPLEYYELGTPYMFYRSVDTKKAAAAPMEVIKKYGNMLKKTATQEGSGYHFARRVIGVVVGKEFVDPKTGIGIIEVLFQGNADGQTVYLTAKYATNLTGGAFCDDKEQYTAAGIVDLTGEINLPSAVKNGGISLDTARVGGGIALDTENLGGGIALDE